MKEKGESREENCSGQWEPQVQNLRGGNSLGIFQNGRRTVYLKHRKWGEEKQMDLKRQREASIQGHIRHSRTLVQSRVMAGF